MSEFKGYFVWCFQRFEGIDKPFIGRIEKDNGTYWRIKHGRKIFSANKGACSTVPFRDEKHARSKEYAEEVASRTSSRAEVTAKEKPDETTAKKSTAKRKQGNTSKVETPRRDVPIRKPKASRVRHQRSGYGEDKKPPGRVRRETPKGQGARFSRRTKETT